MMLCTSILYRVYTKPIKHATLCVLLNLRQNENNSISSNVRVSREIFVFVTVGTCYIGFTFTLNPQNKNTETKLQLR